MVRFRHVVEHVLEAKRDDRLPQAIVFLGDLDCARPLHVELEEIAGLTEIFWIPGNHDCDDNAAWNNLFASEPSEANLHGRVADRGRLPHRWTRRCFPEAHLVPAGSTLHSRPTMPGVPTALPDVRPVNGALLRRRKSAVIGRRFSLTWLRAWAPSVRIFWCRMKRLSAVTTAVGGELSATSLAASG